MAVVVRAVSFVAVTHSSSSSGAAATMMFARVLKSGVALKAVRRGTGLSMGRSAVRLPVVARPMRRCYSQVVGSQWRSEVNGFEGHEVEVDSSNEFPRPSSVPWSKEMANTVHLIGNVGREVEVKYLDTGKVVANASLAVQRNSMKKDDPPSWFEMEFWDSLAEIAGYHLKKGDQVYVTGRLMVDSFMKGDVNQRTARVVVNNVHFVEGNRNTTSSAQSGRSTSSPWTQSRPTQSQSRPAGASLYAAANAETEKLWNAYFSDPDHWWDNRAKKPSPKSPDFKHKTTNEALWIVSKRTPSWVPLQLEKLEKAKQEFMTNGGRTQNRQSNIFSGADFKDF
ncbi:hypothetical protein KC19_9G143900 [Ceratodon purpureus]|uniref:Uncharacterized protein n=1 Tax=Ceratodon purpureus TaxID=3225 RepID=A0A8T0GZS5_CERPU|nr:hypothetical protein KC19_9G143900 [Ceratodon purpureus]